MPEKTKGSPTERQQSYRYCKLCLVPVLIPGLSASKCAQHGWVSSALCVMSQVETKPKAVEQQQPNSGALVPTEQAPAQSQDNALATIDHIQHVKTSTPKPSQAQISQPLPQASEPEQLGLWGGAA